jgi:hypothetical protein
MGTMNDKYGDESDHECCQKCGMCVLCGDCATYGCGRKEVIHASDCATHNEPAYPNGEGDCGAMPNAEITGRASGPG